MSRRRVRAATVASFAWLALAASPALGAPDNDIDPENLVSDSLPPHAAADESAGRKLPFAIFPQVGYGPETGPKIGVKFEGRDLFGGSTFGDVNLLIALKRQQLRARGLVVPEIDVHDPLALGDVELVDALQHAERGVALDGGLLRVGLGADRDLVARKEPLRLGAGHSAVAVVAPVDSGHRFSSWNGQWV